jgi:hypothetical protein
MPVVFSLRPRRPEDALGILEAHRSGLRGTAAKTYSSEVIDSWAPVAIPATKRSLGSPLLPSAGPGDVDAGMAAQGSHADVAHADTQSSVFSG